jgi:hypothetical protein
MVREPVSQSYLTRLFTLLGREQEPLALSEDDARLLALLLNRAAYVFSHRMDGEAMSFMRALLVRSLGR